MNNYKTKINNFSGSYNKIKVKSSNNGIFKKDQKQSFFNKGYKSNIKKFYGNNNFNNKKFIFRNKFSKNAHLRNIRLATKKPIKPPYRTTIKRLKADAREIKKMGFFIFLNRVETQKVKVKRKRFLEKSFPLYFESLVRSNKEIEAKMPRLKLEEDRRKRRSWRKKITLKKRFLAHFKRNNLMEKMKNPQLRIKKILDLHLNSSTYFLSNILIRKGKREKAYKITRFVIAKLKKNRRGLSCIWWRRYLAREILKIRPLITFKPLRLGSMRHKIPTYLSYKKGIALAIRTLGQIARKQAAGTKMQESVYSELTASFSKKSDTYKKILETHKTALDNRAYLRYLRKKRKSK